MNEDELELSPEEQQLSEDMGKAAAMEAADSSVYFENAQGSPTPFQVPEGPEGLQAGSPVRPRAPFSPEFASFQELEQDDLLSQQMAALSQSQGTSLADIGLPDVTQKELDDALYMMGDESSFLEELFTIDTGSGKGWDEKNIPYLGYGFMAHEIYGGIAASAAVAAGSADKEQQLVYLRGLAKAGQDKTILARAGEIGRSFLTTGAEFVAGSPMGGAAARAGRAGLRVVAGKTALKRMYQTRLALATKSLAGRVLLRSPEGVAKAGVLAKTIGGTTAAQQAIPALVLNDAGEFELFGGASGAWTVAAVQRSFAEQDLTEEEAMHLASLMNEQIPAFLQSRGSLYKGFLETLTINTVEMAGVRPIAKLPPFSYHAALQVGVMKRIMGKRGFAAIQEMSAKAVRATPRQTRDALTRVLDGPTEQYLEEILGNVAAEAVVGMASGDSETMSNMLDALPQEFEDAAALYVSSYMPLGLQAAGGGLGAGVKRLRQAQRAKVQKDLSRPIADVGDIKLGETITVESGPHSGLTGRVVEINRNLDPFGQPVRDIERPLELAPFDREPADADPSQPGVPLPGVSLPSIGETIDPMDPDFEEASESSVVLELPPLKKGGEPQRMRVGLEGSTFARPAIEGGDSVSAGKATAGTADDEPAVSPLSAEEYGAFIETGEVSEDRAKQIANKIARGRELTPQEQELREGASEAIEAELQQLARTMGTPETREADREAYLRALNNEIEGGFDGDVEVVGADTPLARAAERATGRAGVPVTFVRSTDNARLPAAGFTNPDTGAVVIDVNGRLGVGVAYHEMLHSGRMIVGDGWYSSLYNDLVELDPEGIRRAGEELDTARRKARMRPASEDLREEESAAKVIERIGDYLAWVDSPQQARYLADLAEQDPGRFQRLMERLQDLLSRLSFGLVNASQRTQLNRAVRDLAGGDMTAPEKAARVLEAFDVLRESMTQAETPAATRAAEAQAPAAATQQEAAQVQVEDNGLQVGDRVRVMGELGTVTEVSGTGTDQKLKVETDPTGPGIGRGGGRSQVFSGVPASMAELVERAAPGQEEFDTGEESKFAVPGSLPAALRKSNKVKPKDGLSLTQSFGDANVEKNLERLDQLATEFPEPLKSPQAWHRFVKSMAGDATESIDPPRRLLDAVKNPEGFAQHLGEFSQAQIEHAEEGLELTRQIRARYQNGEMTPTDTGLMFVWAFLSRMLSAAPHESAFLMAHENGIRPFIDRAAAGQWTEADAAEYTQWLDSWFPRLSEQDKKQKLSGEWAAGARSNMNSIGDQFLPRVAAARIDGVPALQVFHQMLADPETSGKEVRRAFMSTVYASGMGNKLVSFVALIAGKHDVFVIDRWQARNMWSQHWDLSKEEGKRTDPYDGFDTGRVSKKGKRITAGIAAVLDGPMGIALYEALERGMAKTFEEAYGALGRSADVGRYHWESWLWISSQEVGHASLQVFLKDDVAGLGVIEGRDKSRFKGQAMVYLPDRTRGFIVSDSNGTPRFLEAAEWQRIPKGSGARAEQRAAEFVQANGRELSAPDLDQLSWIPGVARYLERRQDSPEQRFALDSTQTPAPQGLRGSARAAFQRWFGKSKAVDSEGRPLVVYHGTRSRIDGPFAFDRSLIGAANDHGFYGRGFYFAESAGEARMYGPNVLAVYLKTDNPLELTNQTGDLSSVGHFLSWYPKLQAIGAGTAELDGSLQVLQDLERQLRDKGQAYRLNGITAFGEYREGYGALFEYMAPDGTSFEIDTRGGPFESEQEALKQLRGRAHDELRQRGMYSAPSLSDFVRTDLGSERLTQAAQAAGHDSIHYGDEWVVFEPTQVKATDNRGTFDPENPDVRFALDAYHGTAFKFDKFTTDAIGTGEGVHAYGWGLYFADKRSVGEWYRRTVTLRVFGDTTEPEIVLQLPDGKRYGFNALAGTDQRHIVGSNIATDVFYGRSASVEEAIAQGREQLEDARRVRAEIGNEEVADLDEYEAILDEFSEGVANARPVSAKLPTGQDVLDAAGQSEVDSARMLLERDFEGPLEATRANAADLLRRYARAIRNDRDRADGLEVEEREGDMDVADLFDAAVPAEERSLPRTHAYSFERLAEGIDAGLLDEQLRDVSVTSGALYKVRLEPDESDFLEWDLPLTEQSDTVKRALNSLLREDVQFVEYRRAQKKLERARRRMLAAPRRLQSLRRRQQELVERDRAAGEALGEDASWFDRLMASAEPDSEGRYDRLEAEARAVEREMERLPELVRLLNVRLSRLVGRMDDDSAIKLAPRLRPEKFTGQTFYRDVLQLSLNSDKAASLALLQAGVRGIRYLDGVSRAEGKGDYNYVVFDAEDITIEERFAVDAWHGSPFTFDRFLTSKIGSGEGAQAYGWGLYFTDRRSIAEWYRDKLAFPNQGLAPAYLNGTELLEYVGDEVVEFAKQQLQKGELIGATTYDKLYELKEKVYPEDMDREGNIPDPDPEFEDLPMFYGDALIDLREGLSDGFLDEDLNPTSKQLPIPTPGSLYKVTLAPEEEDFLLWDKGLYAQSAKVKEALGYTAEVEQRVNQIEKRYNQLSRLKSQAASSRAGDPNPERYDKAIEEYAAEMQALYTERTALTPVVFGGSKFDPIRSIEQLSDGELTAYAYMLDRNGDFRPEDMDFDPSDAAEMKMWRDTLEESVRGMLEEEVMGDEDFKLEDEQSGESIYRMVGRFVTRAGVPGAIRHSDRAASEALREAGIRGIKYLDSDSRSKGEGTFNYVIFDDADITIEERFALAPEPDKTDGLTTAAGNLGFYSPTLRAATKIELDTIPKADVIPLLRKYGAKKAELEWMDLEPLLAEMDGRSLSKDELVQLVSSRQYHLEEVNLLDTQNFDVPVERWQQRQSAFRQFVQDLSAAYTVEQVGDNYEARSINDDFMEKFIGLPLLNQKLTGGPFTSEAEVHEAMLAAASETFKDDASLTQPRFLHLHVAGPVEGYTEFLVYPGAQSAPQLGFIDRYRHWTDISRKFGMTESPIGWVRATDRVLAGGDQAQALFIEEVQSDWMTALRRGQVRTTAAPTTLPDDFKVLGGKLRQEPRAPLPGFRFFFEHSEGEREITPIEMEELEKQLGSELNVGDVLYTFENRESRARLIAPRPIFLSEESAAEEAMTLARERFQRDAPPSPFVKSYYEVLAKRMVMQASLEGKDVIAWTPAWMQAERYDYETFDRLNWQPQKYGPDKGGIRVQLVRSDGIFSSFEVMPGWRESGEMLTSEGEPVARFLPSKWIRELQSAESGSVQAYDNGERIPIEANGFVNVYDSVLVKAFEKLGKRYGAKVTTEVIDTGPHSTELVHGFRLTPELKQAATERGFSLFAMAGNERSREPVGLDMPDGGTIRGPWDRIVRAMGDRYVSVKNYVDWARSRGASMNDDPESALRRFFGKIADRAERIEDGFTRPLSQLMAASGITFAQAGEYVKMRHIPEANAHFAKQHQEREAVKEQKLILHRRVRELKKLRTEQVAARAEAKRERSRMAADGTLSEEGMRYFEGEVAIAEADVKETEALLREAERSLKDAERTINGLQHVAFRIPEGQTAEEFFAETRPMYGIKTSEARRYVEQQNASEQGAALKEIGTMLDQFNQKTRDKMYEDGLLTEAQYLRWNTQFKHYVPMRKADVENQRYPGGRGRGFGVSGPETKMRRGGSRVDNPLSFSLMQAQDAIARGEKNQVGLEFLNWARANAGLLGIEVREAERDDDGEIALKPSEFKMKENGKDMVVNVMDPDLANALKGVGGGISIAQLGPAAQAYTKAFMLWRSLVTSHNPAFMFGNFFRDAMQGLMNTTSLEAKFGVEGLKKATAKDLKGAMAATHRWRRNIRKNPDYVDDSREGRFLEEYRRAGGRIGMYTSLDFESIDENFAKQAALLERDDLIGAGKRTLVSINELVNDANLAVETAVRLAAFMAMRDRGVSANDAALAARQLTTDFNQTGEWGPVLSSIWAFFSATVGGTRRNWQEWKNPSARKLIGGMIAFGYFSHLLNDFVSDDDEDGQSVYSKIPEHEKARNIIFAIPGTRTFVKIPSAYGWSIFFNVGRYGAEFTLGQKTEARVAKDMALETFTAFSPISSSASAYQAMAPTLVEPFVQIEQNQNFAGAPIRPMENPFAPETARHRRHMRSTNKRFVEMAKGINYLTGGDDIDPGWINLGGDDIEHLFEFGIGGAGKFWHNLLYKTPVQMMRGEYNAKDLETAPIIRKFYGARTEFTDTSNFYDELDDLERMRMKIRVAKEDGDYERAAELQRRYGKLLPFLKRAETVKKQVRALTDQAYKDTPYGDDDLLKQANSVIQAWMKDYFAAGGTIAD